MSYTRLLAVLYCAEELRGSGVPVGCMVVPVIGTEQSLSRGSVAVTLMVCMRGDFPLGRDLFNLTWFAQGYTSYCGVYC